MTRIQIRRDTSSNWATYNPVLADGEFALETDTRKLKIGNGEQPYNELAYQEGETYTLPVATADTLGGVKANPTTDEDTQAVNIDPATGLLYTKAGGGVTDAYTKAETDELLDKKENKIITIAPIDINQVTTNSVKNFAITNNELNAYSNASVTMSVAPNKDMTFTGGKDMASYVDIPYQLGQIVTYPFGINYTLPSICFGKINEVGYFEPILMFYNDNGYAGTVISNNNSVWSGNNFTPCVKANSSRKRYGFINSRDIGFAQINLINDNLVEAYTSIPYDQINDIFFLNSITDAEFVSRIKQISIARFATNAYVGENNTFEISKLGLYNSSTPPVDNMDFNEYISGNSLFDISKNISINSNYLKLNIDNTLKINNNELGVNNIVTTQGNTFNGASQLVQLDSSGKLPAIDGSQLTNLPGGNLKYWTGTETDYTGLATKNADTLYRTTDTNTVYLGTIQLSN